MHTTELIEHNIHTLKEASVILNNITTEQYSRPVDAESSASIGKHVRHIIDHYLCLIKGIGEGKSKGMTRAIVGNKVAYDGRLRDQRYEGDLHIAKQKIDEICVQLNNLSAISSADEASARRTIKVSCSTSVQQSSPIEVDSTLQRELVFLQSHTVHHFALIKMIVQGQGMTVNEHFGIAPSTIKHLGMSGCR